MWFRVHRGTGTIVCMAARVANLHSSYGFQLGLADSYVDTDADLDANSQHGEFGVQVGDLADGTAQPDNYPVHVDTPEEIAYKRAAYYKIKAALREANAEQDQEAVTALQAQLDKLTT